ncbi:hypothetical protein [Halorubrum trueperi]|uniref:Uncharacterized protein n=1 Tax=Halorubrum trueperi TaxID=2004704 RepID=A0ABD5UIW1_9EURY
MDLQHSFHTLSRVVEQIESRDRSVRDLEVTTTSDTPGILDVRMTLTIPLCATSTGTADTLITPQAASITGSDGVTITCSISDLVPILTDTKSVAVGEQGVRVEDGEFILTVEFNIEPANSAEDTEQGTNEEIEDPIAARLAAVRSDDVPAYDDIEYLRTLYKSCGTFTEMSERIEMDIAAETVRRYMIEADIHEPTSYDTAVHDAENDGKHEPIDDSESTATRADRAPSPPDSETGDEQLLTDGIGLPDGVTVDDIVEAVAGAASVYEVQLSLELSHAETRDLLRQLNLIDLVLHRIDAPRQDASKDDIVRRMRQYSGANA